MVFVGPSRSGQIRAARKLARDFGRPLRRVGLGEVLSKYIGETEKNLSRIFDAADPGTVLFFDEADALFGKRTEVEDAHDRYANLEVGYFWKRVKRYDGAVILSTASTDRLPRKLAKRCEECVEFPRAGVKRPA